MLKQYFDWVSQGVEGPLKAPTQGTMIAPTDRAIHSPNKPATAAHQQQASNDGAI
jgi:hypothetical protein